MARLLFLAAVNISVLISASVADAQTTDLRVPFRYEMHLNSTQGVATNIDEGLQVLEREVEERIIEVLVDSDTVDYMGIESLPYDTACETDKKSDDCKLVESTVALNVPEAADRVDATFATIVTVQDFAEEFNVEYDEQLFVAYRGPFHFNTTFAVILEPVEQKMNGNEIAIFEHVWLNLLRNYDSNIEILKVTVIYQRCARCLEGGRRTRTRDGIDDERSLQLVKEKNFAFVRIDGQCTDCSSDRALYSGGLRGRDVNNGVDLELTDLEIQFVNEVRNTAKDPSAAGLASGEESTVYFDDPTSATIAALEAPPEAPIDPDQVKDIDDPFEESDFEMMVLALLGAALAIVLCGVICVVIGRRRKAKEQSGSEDYVGGQGMGSSARMEAAEERLHPQPQRSMEEESADGTMVYTTMTPDGEQEVYLRR